MTAPKLACRRSYVDNSTSPANRPSRRMAEDPVGASTPDRGFPLSTQHNNVTSEINEMQNKQLSTSRSTQGDRWSTFRPFNMTFRLAPSMFLEVYNNLFCISFVVLVTFLGCFFRGTTRSGQFATTGCYAFALLVLLATRWICRYRAADIPFFGAVINS